jgi:uncharacterized protein (TIGR03790 family)
LGDGAYAPEEKEKVFHPCSVPPKARAGAAYNEEVMPRARLLALLIPVAAGLAQTSANVLLVVNQSSEVSRRIGEYYARKRAIPAANVCRLRTTEAEEIDWPVYETQIEQGVAACLKQQKLEEKILYIVTTLGVPLRVKGEGSGQTTETCAVDSELTLLYAGMHGGRHPRTGFVPNPFYQQRDRSFAHPAFPIYLVTRLAGYDFTDVKGIIDRSLAARNRGRFVIDLSANDENAGNQWLRSAALLLPANRVVLDESEQVLYNITDVIGYAAWGSNDKNRHQRHLGFRWLPGAIVTEFVSTNGRTFKKPPEDWNISTWDKSDQPRWFAGAPQTLTADYIHEGATGASGHVAEPYLGATPRPDFLLPAYFSGRNLAESYYMSIVGLSWQNIVVGDPLCSLGAP